MDDLYKNIERERLTEKKVREMDACQIVEWIHELENQIDSFEKIRIDRVVQGMMVALGLNRPEEEIIKDYGMLGVHNIKAVKESLDAYSKVKEDK